MRTVAVVAALGALAACFERGRERPAGRDAVVVAVGVAGDAGAAAASPRDHREPTGAADPDATITLALEAEPATLNPLIGGDAITQRVAMGDVYQGLLQPAARLGAPPEPCLADTVEVSADGLTWTFHLRAGVRWHDGAPLTAADVGFTLDAARAQASWLAGDLEDLREDTLRDDEVVLRFARPRADRGAAFARLPILPRHGFAGVALAQPGAMAEAPASRAPVGTGPLRVVAWRRGAAIELARWDGAWGARAGAARVVYTITSGREHTLRLLAAGAIDVAIQLPRDEAERAAAGDVALGRFTYRSPAYLTAIFNTRRAAIAADEHRRALTALLDRDGIAATLLGTRAITGPFPEGDPGVDATVAPVPFDRALAARLLGEARPSIELLVPAGSTVMARVADIWASDARGLVTLRVVTVPFAELIARLRAGDFSIALTSMTSGPELDLWALLSSEAPAEDAWTGLADAALDAALRIARDDPDPARRAEARRQIHRRLAARLPLAFLAADVRVGLARRDIGGLAGAVEGRAAASGKAVAREGPVSALAHALRAVGRVALTAVVTFALAWTLAELAPGSAAERAARAAGTLPPDDAAATGARARAIAHAARVHDLEGAPVVRVARASARLLVLDLGRSWRDRRAVTALLGDALVDTAALAAMALLIALGAGAAAGWAAAQARRRAAALAIGTLTAAGAALPPAWLAQLALGAGGDGVIAAALVLALAPAAAVALQVRAQLVGYLAGPLATAHRARGASPARVAAHGLWTAAPTLAPLLTGVGAYALGAALVVERAFARPGLGRLTLDAAASGDAPVLAGVAALAGALVATLAVTADALARRADPRLRDEVRG